MQIFFGERLNKFSFRLEKDEARHCIRVLRRKAGDQISCVDGKGNFYKGNIENYTQSEVVASIEQHIEMWGEKEIHLTLAVSPLRQKDRYEWMLEKAVELGVNTLIPIRSKHTMQKLTLKYNRLEQIAISAMKQCKRSLLPEIKEITTLPDFLALPHQGLKLVAQADESQPLSTYYDTIGGHKNAILLIGPEGDFTPEEIKLAREQGFQGIQLGENRLRTETAAIHALSSLKMMYGY